MVRYEKPPSEAVLQARQRRLDRAQQVVVEADWFINEVLGTVRVSLHKRMRVATEYLKSKVVVNISRPVTKAYSSISLGSRTVHKVRVTDRSKPGEFPKADTTLLMKTIFGTVLETAPGVYDGFVGSPVDYGLFLELFMDRSFLVRTFHEEQDKIRRILGGEIIA